VTGKSMAQIMDGACFVPIPAPENLVRSSDGAKILEGRVRDALATLRERLRADDFKPPEKNGAGP
jgi:hypothetical protein